jgi:hypothetical protein
MHAKAKDDVADVFQDAKQTVTDCIDTYYTVLHQKYQHKIVEYRYLSQTDAILYDATVDLKVGQFLAQLTNIDYKTMQHTAEQEEYILKKIEEIYLFQDEIRTQFIQL